MGEAVHAWNTMTYAEGALFSLWLMGMYYIKLRMDRKFGKRP
jgi:hypothetical protein